jgi:hypothetical protein
MKYRSPWHACRVIWKEEGCRGIFRGNVATLLREVVCYFFQFGTYEYYRRLYTSLGYAQESVLDMSVPYTIFAGHLYSSIIVFPRLTRMRRVRVVFRGHERRDLLGVFLPLRHSQVSATGCQWC